MQEIVTTNAVLRENMELGQPPYKVVEAWDQVQLQTATLVNADQPGLASGSHAPGKPLRLVCAHASIGFYLALLQSHVLKNWMYAL